MKKWIKIQIIIYPEKLSKSFNNIIQSIATRKTNNSRKLAIYNFCFLANWNILSRFGSMAIVSKNRQYSTLHKQISCSLLGSQSIYSVINTGCIFQIWTGIFVYNFNNEGEFLNKTFRLTSLFCVKYDDMLKIDGTTR